MNELTFSVVLCTHNPKLPLLLETLESLRKQSFPCELWELIIVDNCSADPVSQCVDLSWKKRVRVVKEEKLGLTNARVRGFKEATGLLVVLVDDDNLLAVDFLSNAILISEQYSWIGAFGGRVSPRFEVAPPDWIKSRMQMLAVVDVPDPRHALLKDMGIIDCAPVGAGMVLRRDVALKYCESIISDPIRSALDRTGESLVSGGDNDICLFCQDIGFGTGVFPELQLEHIIPSSRLALPYFLRLAEGMAFSHVVLREVWCRKWGKTGSDLGPTSRLDRMVQLYKAFRWRLKVLRQKECPEIQLLDAERRGVIKAMKLLSNLPASESRKW